MPEKQRVILCDIDDVLTFNRKNSGKRERVIDERAIKRIKKLIEKGYKVAFITGKSANYVLADFVPVLKKYGLENKCLLYGEHGFYRINGKEVLMVPEGKAFQKKRGKLLSEIEAVLAKKGVKYFFPKNDAKLVTLYFKLKDPSPANKAILKQSVKQAIANLNKSKAASHEIKFHLTKSGCDVYPASQSKGNAVVDALKRWGLLKQVIRERAYKDIKGQFVGRAYGDLYTDRQMARGPKISFYRIDKKSPEFLKRTRFLGLKFRSRSLRQDIAKKQRALPRKSLKRKTLNIARRILPK